MSSLVLHAIPFACPLDGLSLEPDGPSLTCTNRHRFDVSTAGYVNLLLPQFKASRDPGDSKSMVSARRRVLDSSAFDPLADAVCEMAQRQAGKIRDELPLLIDAGCGEGFYTARLAASLRDALPRADPLVLGVDISKWAVTAAAKRHKSVGWAVASNKRLPVCQGAASLITSVLGFETWSSWAQLQTTGQAVIVVDAGARHLIELRQIIYPTLRVHDAPAHTSALSSGYVLTAETDVVFDRTIRSSYLLADLLEMTPHGHKSTPAAREAVCSLSSLALTFHLVIRVFQRQ